MRNFHSIYNSRKRTQNANNNGKSTSTPLALSPLSWLPGFTAVSSKVQLKSPNDGDQKSAGCGAASAAKEPAAAAKSNCAEPKSTKGKDNDELDFNNMNLEEFADLFPEDALNPRDRPTFWPHDEDEQLTAEDEVRQKLGSSHH